MLFSMDKVTTGYGKAQVLKEVSLHVNENEIVALVGIKKTCVNHWRLVGLLKAGLANDKNEYLFEHPTEEIIEKIRQKTRYKCMKRQVCFSAN